MILRLFFTGALVLSACGSRDADRPSVLLVTLDTTRADYIGAYGRPGNPTPHLDRLASQGTRFDHAVSTAAVTPVSHASILTGRYNHEHGLRVIAGAGGFRLPAMIPTLATVLTEHGYETAAIHSSFTVSSHFGFDRGFRLFDDIDAVPDRGGDGRVRWDVVTYQRRSDETTERALEFLRTTNRPFLLWLHYWDPHDPGRVPPGSDAKRRSAQLYAEEVSYMDSQFGRVLERLETLELADETIVVVVADHGEGLGDHGWMAHRILYQEQMRVPLLIKLPGQEQVANVHDLVRTVDILPTLLDYLGLAPPAGVSGKSLRELISGRTEDAPRLAFADQINQFDANARMLKKRPNDDFLYCVTDGRWKLVYRPTRPALSELFDLAADPREAHNLWENAPEERLRLLTQLAYANPWVTEPPSADYELGGDELEALQALGYVEGTAPPIAVEVEWAWTCPNPAHAVVSESPGVCAECGLPYIPRAMR